MVEEKLAKDKATLSPAGVISKTQIRVEGEKVQTPGRVYFDEFSEAQISGLSNEQQRIAWCLYSQYHNGHIREKYLRKLPDVPTPYTAPFILQLLGEYVEEIESAIQQAVLTNHTNIYRIFLATNPEFGELLSARIASYWNEYYRGKYPHIEKYPPYEVLTFLKSTSGPL